MFGPQHAPAGQSYLDWAELAVRVPIAACHAPTCTRKAKINHVWPTEVLWVISEPTQGMTDLLGYAVS